MSSVPQDDGKPPRDADSIRATLQAIHRDRKEQPEGPLKQGMRAQDRLIIATFHDLDVARVYQQALAQGGILSSLTRSGHVGEVGVDYEDRRRAGEILEEHRRTCPDRRRRGIRRDYDFLILGVVLGITLGFIYVFGSLSKATSAVGPLAFGVTGALMGHLADRIRGQWRVSRRLRFGVRELLILSVLPALVFFLWKLIPQLLD